MKVFVWTCVVLGIVSALLSLLLPGLTCRACGGGNARNAQATLKTIASAQEDFREHDRDGDGRREYWRRDVAGLYALLPPGEMEMIRLIEVSAAAADLTPLPGWDLGSAGPGIVDLSSYGVHAPKAGHWFVALPFEDENDGARDPRRFAVCAVPDSTAAGKVTYALTQDRVVWERPGIDVPFYFPLDPAAEGWRRSD